LELQFGHDLSAVETQIIPGNIYNSRVLQFGHDLSAVETRAGSRTPDLHPRCFNSATTFQPWKRGEFTAWDQINMMLQFGHDLSAVETLVNQLFTVAQELLQFGHDLSAVETNIMTAVNFAHPFGFNSATTFQPWKRSLKGVGHFFAFNASIRPRPFSRGNDKAGRH